MYQKRNNELEIISLFLGDYKRQFYLREISRLTKIPLKTTQSKIIALEKKGILKGNIRGRHKYFRLNLDSIKTKLYLLQAEIDRTIYFIEKYKLFKTILKEIKTDNPIIVFGSFAKSTASKESDIDILIISNRKEDLPTHLIPYKIHRIDLSKNSFIKALRSNESLIKEIEENHVILNNHSTYVNIMWDHYGNQ